MNWCCDWWLLQIVVLSRWGSYSSSVSSGWSDGEGWPRWCLEGCKAGCWLGWVRDIVGGEERSWCLVSGEWGWHGVDIGWWRHRKVISSLSIWCCRCWLEQDWSGLQHRGRTDFTVRLTERQWHVCWKGWCTIIFGCRGVVEIQSCKVVLRQLRT